MLASSADWESLRGSEIGRGPGVERFESDTLRVLAGGIRGRWAYALPGWYGKGRDGRMVGKCRATWRGAFGVLGRAECATGGRGRCAVVDVGSWRSGFSCSRIDRNEIAEVGCQTKARCLDKPM